MMVSYFALSALLSVDWGACVGGRRDILRAGLPCVLAAAAWTSIMSLVIVSNTASWVGTDGVLVGSSPADPLPFSFRWALFQGSDLYPKVASAAILILFGLAALAPAVTSLAKFRDLHRGSLARSAAESGDLDCLCAGVCADGQLSSRSPGPDLTVQWASSSLRSWVRWPATLWEGIRFDPRSEPGSIRLV